MIISRIYCHDVTILAFVNLYLCLSTWL